MFENIRCFIMKDELGNCNDFVDMSDDTAENTLLINNCLEDGKLLTLEETVEYQKTHNKPILTYEGITDKKLIEYFVSIGGKIV